MGKLIDLSYLRLVIPKTPALIILQSNDAVEKAGEDDDETMIKAQASKPPEKLQQKTIRGVQSNACHKKARHFLVSTVRSVDIWTVISIFENLAHPIENLGEALLQAAISADYMSAAKCLTLVA